MAGCRLSDWLVAMLVLGVMSSVPGPPGAARAASQPVAAAGSAGVGMSRAEVRRQAIGLAALGRELFFDARLSASGRQACATCHDPEHAFGPPNALAVQIGGSDLKQPGLRAGRRSSTCRSCRSSPSTSSTARTKLTRASTTGRPAASPGTAGSTAAGARPGSRCSRPSRWPIRARTRWSRTSSRRAMAGTLRRSSATGSFATAPPSSLRSSRRSRCSSRTGGPSTPTAASTMPTSPAWRR